MQKEHILSEIKRLAAANGGKPLGRLRFENETGIRESDWSGVHWARWSDAVREAGLEPNLWQAAYGEDALIEKFVLLIRDLGRFPVTSEIKMRARGDSSFPSHSTFAKLGSKVQLAAKVAEYCKRRSGHADVLAVCASISKPRDRDTDVVADAKEEYGFVYLLKSGRYYKIGRSNSAGRRERELAIQLPEKANAVHAIRTDDPAGIEAYWHKRFEAKRMNGEWFDLASAEVQAFKRRKFM